MPEHVTTDGSRLCYEVVGRGSPTLLFIHGLGANASHWRRQADYFGRRHRVVCFDLPGHGKSDALANDMTVEAVAARLVSATRQLRARNTVLVGHGYGASPAMTIAADYPELVRALVLVDDLSPVSDAVVEAFAGPDFGAAARRFNEMVTARMPDRRLARRIVSEWANVPPGLAYRALRHAREEFDMHEVASRIEQPSLLVTRAGGDVTRDVARGFIPHVQYAAVVGAGHFLYLEVPDQLNAMLARFIEAV